MRASDSPTAMALASSAVNAVAWTLTKTVIRRKSFFIQEPVQWAARPHCANTWAADLASHARAVRLAGEPASPVLTRRSGLQVLDLPSGSSFFLSLPSMYGDQG